MQLILFYYENMYAMSPKALTELPTLITTTWVTPTSTIKK
jgi:hypothetical protein